MSEEENTVFGIEVNGETQTVSLADIAGVDMGGIEEFRGGGATPAGIYEWRVVAGTMDTVTYLDRKENEDVTKPVIDFELEALACRQTKDKMVDVDDLAGIKHYERFFISDLVKDLGRVKAFLQDMGCTGSGTLQDLLDAATGQEFVGGIKQRKDKNDPDRVYANIDFATVEPLAGGVVPVQEPAPVSGGLSIR